ncbi:hypothetical protein HIM_08953 [Hirsutella minnesotensis 3608]|uniref:Uncharacterized protein n=1 Tax=Hirsutella minnesotensis 3608 TaxID=1043627 RepID=A0A0F7ZGX3_9HYPO|nr:hypothetical protein HIM_08953 [Hirsutella minnesotensis 3608]
MDHSANGQRILPPGRAEPSSDADMIAPEDRRAKPLELDEPRVDCRAAAAKNPKRTQSMTTLHCPNVVCCASIAYPGKSNKASRLCSKEGGCLSIVFSGDGRQGPEVQATNASGSFSSTKRERAESSKSLLDSQMSRIMEELSKAASVGRRSTQQSSLASGKSPRPSQGSVKTGVTMNEPLYIFSPLHRQSACFMYRSKRGTSADAYEFDHVQVRTVQWYGSPAYLMAMSDEDETAKHLEDNCRPRAASVQVNTLRPNQSIGLPSTINDRTSLALTGGGLSPIYPKCSPQLINGAIAEVAIDKIQDRLKTTTQHRHVLRSDDGGSPGLHKETLYLVSDKDIADSLRLAFAELEHTEFAGAKRSLSSGDCKLRSDSLLLPKLNRQCNVITTHSPAMADPATIFNIPTATLSSLDRADGQRCVGTLDDATGNPAPLRRSITESARGTGESDKPKTMTRLKLGCHDLLCTQRDASDGVPSKSLKVRSSSVDKEKTGSLPYKRSDSVVKVGASGSGMSPVDGDTNMTSFPKLPPRHCTNEWLKPPVDLDQLTESCPPDFYKMGVDAHSGGALSRQLDGNEAGPPTWTLRCDFSLFDTDPFSCDKAPSRQRNQNGRPSSTTTAEKRPGASIGSSSHRRRSSQVPSSRSPQGEQGDGASPGFFGRLRSEGLRMFQRHDCPSPLDGNGPETTSEVRIKSRVGRRRIPSTPRSRLVGPPLRQTGKEASLRRARRHICSEDNRPHVCENDLDSNSPGADSGL